MSIELNKEHLDCIDKRILSNYHFEQTIGRGNFGKVKLARLRPTNEQYAVKILNKGQIERKNEMHLVQRELKIIKHFNHLNVIYVHEIIEDDINYFIIMDYCENGELFDYIVKKKRLGEEEASVFFYQLINGIEYIHSKNIVHRDLKPENLLLTKNKTLKIIDFGLSTFCNEENGLSTKCGSPSYAAPEIIQKNKYDGFKTDIWCCGIILYAMLCGFLPFEGESNKELFKNIIECKIEFPHYLSKLGEGMIREMLNTNPNKRIQIKDIKTSPFYLKGKEYSDYHLWNKKKNKIKGLHIVNSNSEANAIKKHQNSINKTKFISPKSKSISEKIGEILKTDASLYYNLKTIGLGTCSSNIFSNGIITKDPINQLFLAKLKPKFPLKQLIENRMILQQKKNDNVTNTNTQANKKQHHISIERNVQFTNLQTHIKLQTCNSIGKNNKLNNHCLPTEPKEFNELLKLNFTKYINTKPCRSNRNNTNQSSKNNNNKSKPKLSSVKAQSMKTNDNRLFSSKKTQYLPKLTSFR